MIRFLFVLMFGSAVFAQTESYRYIIIPERFSAQKDAHQYGLNELSRKYFEQLGYTVFYDSEELPPMPSTCDRLYMDVEGSNNMFRTLLTMRLKDCNNAVLFESPSVTEKDKNNHVAYNKAMRSILKSYGVRSTASAIESTPPPVNSDKSGVAPEPSTITLYAQPIENGYQLVDTTPRVVMRIFKTSREDVFTASDGVHSGVLVKTPEGKWIFEYFTDGKNLSREMNIRF